MGSLKRGRVLHSGRGFDKAVYQEMLAAPSALDALPSLEHSTDPARRRRGDHERDIRVV